MAITLIKRPDDFARVNDTNRATYEFSSNNWTQPNFQFYFTLKYYEVNGATKELGSYKVFPLSGGTVQFNPSEIYRNYLEQEINLSSTGLVECLQMAKKFQLFIYEYYGTPPVKILTGNWYEQVPTTFFIGCQQDIPYDYIPLNPWGNKLWVMNSGFTSTTLSYKGKFLTDANRYELDNDDYLFLYALGDNVGGRPDKIQYKIYYWGWTLNSNVLPRTSITGADGLEISNYTDSDESKQMSLPVNTQQEINTGGDSFATGSGGGGGIGVIKYHSGITSTIIYDTNINFTFSNSRAYYIPVGPYQLLKTGALSGFTNTWVYYEVNLMKSGAYNDYCYSNTIAAPLSMPVGSQIYEAQTEGIFALLTSGGTVMDGDVTHPGTGPWSHRSGPVYTSKTSTTNSVLNLTPFQVFRKNKCNKYDKWQLFWLNPHGGFDTYVFDRKRDIEYKISRDTFKQKLNYANYTPYQAGEKVFNTEVQQNVTLRTNNLTQMEAQLLIQLAQSPVVYALRTYYYSGATYSYGVPYIVETDTIKYPQKRNEKEIFMEIKIRPANNKIIQKQ
jgi:hypothetical protein